MEGVSVLKNSFALSSASELGAENDVFAVFWPCFGPLLDHRPGRRRLFQQAAIVFDTVILNPLHLLFTKLELPETIQDFGGPVLVVDQQVVPSKKDADSTAGGAAQGRDLILLVLEYRLQHTRRASRVASAALARDRPPFGFRMYVLGSPRAHRGAGGRVARLEAAVALFHDVR